MFSKHPLAILISLSAFMVAVANATEIKPEFYPTCNGEPLQVSKEDYQPGSLSLHGLTGLYINLDDVLKGAQSRKVKLHTDLKGAVAQKLETAGIRLLSKEEMEKTPGQPEMSMYPSYPKHLGPFKPDEPRIEYNAHCCTAGIWTSFTQGASTLRTPLLNHKLATWGEGHNTNDCSDVGKWLGEVVLKTVDDFISAKQKADQDYAAWLKNGKTEAKHVAATTTVPESTPEKPIEIRETNDTQTLACDTAILLYAEIFPTASATVSRAKSGILRKVADNMKACPQYRYRIETHSDQRSDEEYNDVLSARRAVAIRNFMVEQGVDEEQFDLRFYGERRPLVEGNSEEAWAANRRVTITPLKPK